MEKTTKYGIAIFAVIVVAGFFLVSGKDTPALSGNAVALPSDGTTQEVVLSYKDYNYYPESVEVEAGKPVSIRLDDSVFGCFRDFTIRSLGINKYLATANDALTFTPDTPGTYVFACSMGMGQGKLIVK